MVTCFVSLLDRVAVPSPLGVHDPHQVRVQLRHAVASAKHRQLSLPQGLKGCGPARHASQHLRENHPVHRARTPRLRHEGNSVRSAHGRTAY